MSRHIVEVDVGPSVNPTAIAVLEVTTRQDLLNAHNADPPEPLPLKTPYPEQVAHVQKLLGRPPLGRPNTDLVVHMTGMDQVTRIRSHKDPVSSPRPTHE